LGAPRDARAGTGGTASGASLAGPTTAVALRRRSHASSGNSNVAPRTGRGAKPRASEALRRPEPPDRPAAGDAGAEARTKSFTGELTAVINLSTHKGWRYATFATGGLYLLRLLLYLSYILYFIIIFEQNQTLLRQAGASPQTVEQTLFAPLLNITLFFAVLGGPFVFMILGENLLGDDFRTIEGVLTILFMLYGIALYILDVPSSGRVLMLTLVPFKLISITMPISVGYKYVNYRFDIPIQDL